MLYRRRGIADAGEKKSAKGVLVGVAAFKVVPVGLML
jgi:hypothetical protein